MVQNGKNKQIGDSELKNLLGDLFNDDIPLVAVIFGNYPYGADIDILCLTENEPSQERSNVGILDLLNLSVEKASYLIELLDPIITELILTGKYFLGDRSIWDNLTDKLHNVCDIDIAISHLLRESSKWYIIAYDQFMAHQYKESRDLIKWSIINGAYASSYLHFAKYYAKSSYEPIDLRHLIEIFPALRMTMNCVEKIKIKGTEIETSMAREVLKNWESEILHISAS